MNTKDSIYFFHNVYGDCLELLANTPQEVVAVPWGPDQKTEAERNQVIQEISIAPSALPSVIFWVNHSQEHDGSLGIWAEVRVSDLPKPWSWEKIYSERRLILDKLTREILV